LKFAYIAGLTNVQVVLFHLLGKPDLRRMLNPWACPPSPNSSCPVSSCPIDNVHDACTPTNLWVDVGCAGS
jgi:hypothetical protein